MKSIEHYWYSQNIIAWLLLPLSFVFCILSFFRRVLFKLNILKSYQAPVPVFIIGNISVGGTGKTPLIIELVKQLQQKGFKPAVISRGYGSQADSYPYQVTQHSRASEAGDEPLLIFRRTQCPLVIGADRRADIEYLLQHNDCDIILSDDGLQHYALRRDVEIAVVDSSRYLGNGFCLPAGPLRERAARLRSVDMVLYNGGQQATNMQIKAAAPQALFSHDSTTGLSPQKIHAVAGIGNPQRFFDLLSSLGYEIIPHIFSDHYQYQETDLLFDDNLNVLMTEKDAVKCLAFNLPRHWFLPIEVKLSNHAQQQFNQLLQDCNG